MFNQKVLVDEIFERVAGLQTDMMEALTKQSQLENEIIVLKNRVVVLENSGKGVKGEQIPPQLVETEPIVYPPTFPQESRERDPIMENLESVMKLKAQIAHLKEGGKILKEQKDFYWKIMKSYEQELKDLGRFD